MMLSAMRMERVGGEGRDEGLRRNNPKILTKMIFPTKDIEVAEGEFECIAFE